MLGSGILETAVGLFMIYLLLSVIATALGETWGYVTNLRGLNLYRWICETLGGQENAKSFYDYPTIASMKSPYQFPFSLFCRNQWVKRAFSFCKHPSYIKDKDFAVSLVNYLAGHPTNNIDEVVSGAEAKLGQSQTTGVIKALASQSSGDFDDFLTRIMTWYNDAQSRVTGWFKRDISAAVFILSLVFVIAINADTVRISSTLWHNANLRATVAAIGEKSISDINSASVGSEKNVGKALGYAEDLCKSDILGWNAIDSDDSSNTNECVGWLVRISGWILTAFALSLGAPFWFDLLQKFTNIRSAGNKPSEHTDSTDPKPVS